MNTVYSKTNQNVPAVDYNKTYFSVNPNDPLYFDTLFQGTNGDDVMNGTAGDDGMRGYGGNDVMNGGYGNDRMAGYFGNNTMNGGPGIDYMFTGNGATNDGTTGDVSGINIMNGGPGADHFVLNAQEWTGLKGTNTMVIQDLTNIDTIDIVTYGKDALNFSSFDTNNDGVLNTADKGVTALHNADGTTGIQLAVSDHYNIQVQNQTQLSSTSFSFTHVS
jgi:hypothetical protein